MEEFKLSHATLTYSVRGRDMVIYGLRTPQRHRHQGCARAALAALLTMADEDGCKVSLLASPLDNRTSLARLVRFYETFGFKVTGRTNFAGDPYMQRSARRRNPAHGEVHMARFLVEMVVHVPIHVYVEVEASTALAARKQTQRDIEQNGYTSNAWFEAQASGEDILWGEAKGLKTTGRVDPVVGRT